MANSVKGEIEFSLDGAAYRMVLDFNALCEVEDALGGGLAETSLASFKAVRAILWGSLQRHHPGLSLMDAGDLIEGLGVAEAGSLVARAMEASGLSGGDDNARPPRAARRAAASKKP